MQYRTRIYARQKSKLEFLACDRCDRKILTHAAPMVTTKPTGAKELQNSHRSVSRGRAGDSGCAGTGRANSIRRTTGTLRMNYCEKAAAERAGRKNRFSFFRFAPEPILQCSVLSARRLHLHWAAAPHRLRLLAAQHHGVAGQLAAQERRRRPCADRTDHLAQLGREGVDRVA
jgi:hypothetical protein